MAGSSAARGVGVGADSPRGAAGAQAGRARPRPGRAGRAQRRSTAYRAAVPLQRRNWWPQPSVRGITLVLKVVWGIEAVSSSAGCGQAQAMAGYSRVGAEHNAVSFLLSELVLLLVAHPQRRLTAVSVSKS